MGVISWLAQHIEWFAYAALCLSCVALGYALRVAEENHEQQKARNERCKNFYSRESVALLNRQMESNKRLIKTDPSMPDKWAIRYEEPWKK
jgi:Flp pilus assembly protein TadB